MQTWRMHARAAALRDGRCKPVLPLPHPLLRGTAHGVSVCRRHRVGAHVVVRTVRKEFHLLRVLWVSALYAQGLAF